MLSSPGRWASGGMADAHGSGPCVRKDVGVQLPPRPHAPGDPCRRSARTGVASCWPRGRAPRTRVPGSASGAASLRLLGWGARRRSCFRRSSGSLRLLGWGARRRSCFRRSSGSLRLLGWGARRRSCFRRSSGSLRFACFGGSPVSLVVRAVGGRFVLVAWVGCLASLVFPSFVGGRFACFGGSPASLVVRAASGVASLAWVGCPGSLVFPSVVGAGRSLVRWDAVGCSSSRGVAAPRLPLGGRVQVGRGAGRGS